MSIFVHPFFTEKVGEKFKTFSSLFGAIWGHKLLQRLVCSGLAVKSAEQDMKVVSETRREQGQGSIG
jgi:hypothetical protein